MEVIQGEPNINQLFDEVPMVPPFNLETVEINEETDDIPGRIVMDEQGKYFKQYIAYQGFSDFLTTGYDYMLDVRIPLFLKKYPKFTTPHNSTIHLEDIEFRPAGTLSDMRTHPRMYRLSGGTYTTCCFVTLVETFPDGFQNVRKNVKLGEIPLMLGSSRCLLSRLSPTERHNIGENLNDPDGYFIIRGAERVVLIQDQLRLNRILLYNGDNKGKLVCKMTVSTDHETDKKIELFYDNYKNSINIHLNSFGEPHPTDKVPVLLMYSIFGYEKIHDILHHILQFTNEQHHQRVIFALTGSIVEYERLSSDVYSYIYFLKTGGKRIDPLNYEQERNKLHTDIINSLFPNMNDEPTNRKLDMLAMMIVRMAEYKAGITKLDDRDSWSNKRLETAYTLMESLFKYIWNDMVRSKDGIQNKLNKSIKSDHLEIISKEFNKNRFKDIFIKSFMTDWGIPNKPGLRENVTDVLSRNSLLSAYSHIRRVNTPGVSKTTKQDALRMVHFSALHYICPIETPEGGRIGLVKNMTSVCITTVDIDDKPIYNTIKDYLYQNKDIDTGITYKVMLNGKFLGWVNGLIVYQHLRKLKLSNQIHPHTCTVYDDELEFLYIHTDASRPLAPYLTVENDILVLDKLRTDIYNKTKSKVLPSFKTMLENGAVEYVDAFEQKSINLVFSRQELINRVNIKKQSLAKINEQIQQSNDENDIMRLQKERSKIINLKTITHCDIDPTAMMSISASIIPYAHKMQAPRNTYQASHGKQAMGLFSTNHKARVDTSARLLAYPSRPLFEPQMNEMIGMNEQPSGQMVTLALLTYGGWEQEDAIILNRASVQRGLFMSIKYYTKSLIIQKGTHEPDIPGVKIKFKDELGIPPLSAKRSKENYRHIGPDGLPILNSYVKEGDCVIGKIRVSENNRKQDTSIYMEVGEKGIIDRVSVLKNMAGQYVVHVKIRDLRKPVVGDKFASRYAQKATVGLIARVEDIPFTVNGITPDVIINPLPIAGRMTMGKIFEIIGSKTMALKGEFINATSFRSYDENEFAKILESYGYSFDGEEVMYDGKTGKKIEAKIFTGPCYYQALRHQVVDKVQSRGEGPKKLKTGQPTEGRANRGAIRLGGMERDALISHGASALIKERMMYSSDAVDINVCMTCGNTVADATVCYNCHSTNIGRLTTTSIFLLLRNLLAAGGIDIKVMTERYETEPVDDEPNLSEELKADLEENMVEEDIKSPDEEVFTEEFDEDFGYNEENEEQVYSGKLYDDNY